MDMLISNAKVKHTIGVKGGMIVIKSLESDTIAYKLESPARSRISTILHLVVVTRVEAADAAGGFPTPK